MLRELKSGLSRFGLVVPVGLVMVRRSDGCSSADIGFSTHLLGVLSMAAGEGVGSVRDGDDRCRELDVWKHCGVKTF